MFGLSRAPLDPGGYWYHAGITILESLLGFAIGSVVGAVFGFAIVHWPGLGDGRHIPLWSAFSRCRRWRWRP